MSTGVYPAPRINNCCFCEQHTFQRNSPLWGREKMSLVVTNSSSGSLKAGETSARFSLSTSGPRTRSQHHETEHPEWIRSLRVSFQCVNKQYRWCSGVHCFERQTIQTYYMGVPGAVGWRGSTGELCKGETD